MDAVSRCTSPLSPTSSDFSDSSPLSSFCSVSSNSSITADEQEQVIAQAVDKATFEKELFERKVEFWQKSQAVPLWATADEHQLPYRLEVWLKQRSKIKKPQKPVEEYFLSSTNTRVSQLRSDFFAYCQAAGKYLAISREQEQQLKEQEQAFSEVYSDYSLAEWKRIWCASCRLESDVEDEGCYTRDYYRFLCEKVCVGAGHQFQVIQRTRRIAASCYSRAVMMQRWLDDRATVNDFSWLDIYQRLLAGSQPQSSHLTFSVDGLYQTPCMWQQISARELRTVQLELEAAGRLQVRPAQPETEIVPPPPRQLKVALPEKKRRRPSRWSRGIYKHKKRGV